MTEFSTEADLCFQQLSVGLHALSRSNVDQAFIRRYLGTMRPVLSVATDDLRRLAKETIRPRSDWPVQAWLALLDLLYAGGCFEHRVLAGFLLGMLHDLRRTVDLRRLRTWLAGAEGWAEVDTTCQSAWTAQEVLARWQEWQPFLSALADDPNVSLRRASLVLLVTPLRKSTDEQLTRQAYATVEQLQHEKNVMITKAISWVLRTMAPMQPESVAAFLDSHAATLPSIAIRETRKKLDTGRKTTRKK